MDTLVPALIEAWQRGEEEAVHHIFTIFYLRSVNIALLSGLSPEEAKDCAQEAFIVAFEHRHQLRNSVAFPLWFHRILTHHIFDTLQTKTRDKKRSQEILPELTGQWVQSQPVQPEDVMLTAERRAQLWQHIQTLELRYRVPLVLRYYGDLSFREVATVLNKREGTIRVTVHRGLQQLRLLLSEEESTGEANNLFPLPIEAQAKIERR